MRTLVAIAPLLGSLLVPLLVPLLMLKVSMAAGVMAVVVVGSLWFVWMLRWSEMPS
ncbi:MAG: hypothetical protein R6W06_11350 [Prochlorococcaceae cyanobacterium]